MMSENMTARADNKGLTVKINFFSMNEFMDEFSSDRARHRIKGRATNAGTGKAKMFNDAGELLSLLSKWNVEKFKELKAAKR